MTAATARAAGDYLADLAGRLMWMAPEGFATVRDTMATACGGRLDATGPDGRRASGLTVSGLPFEVSVSGGGGSCSPAIRYITEPATQVPTFADRVAAQLDTVTDLLARLPNAHEVTGDSVRHFIEALYPYPEQVSARRRLAIWTGVVHHADAPRYVSRLKVYGASSAVPGSLERLRKRWPDFGDLMALPENDEFFRYAIAALEVDAHGEISQKIYLRSRHRDAAVPMKLVRHFGEPAWEMLSELVRCGIDAAQLHRYTLFMCLAKATSAPTLSLSLTVGPEDDITEIVRELAIRHHGSTHAVDVLEQTARASGAHWRYSALGLGFSTERGVDKLNVYGTPTWDVPP